MDCTLTQVSPRKNKGKGLKGTILQGTILATQHQYNIKVDNYKEALGSHSNRLALVADRTTVTNKESVIQLENI